MSQSRQLAAIMFTDIVGYTAMMQADEQKAVAVIKHYNTTLEKWVTHFNGQVLNYYGDGSLCIFPSVTDAVNCSLAVQKDLKTEPAVPLRIGLHIGEVFFEDAKALGDGVNVASRVQSLGQENTILISEEVHDKIKNNTSITTASLGHFDFKNVGKSMEVFALTNEGLFVPQRKMLEGKLKKKNLQNRNLIAAISFIMVVIVAFFIYKYFLAKNDSATDKSIAVLPFVDMSAGKDQEYFSDGLSEELLNLLTKIPELKVIGRTSSFSFKGKNEDLRIIGEKLGVANLLEGSVRKDGNKIRVTAQLIRADDGSHLWSETYDRNLKSILKLQDEIAGAVVKELKLKLIPVMAKDTQTVNTEVYNLILNGNYFLEKRDKENLELALTYYERALAIDSLSVRGWAGIARCYNLQTQYSSLDNVQKNRVWIQARLAANKAIQLDDKQTEALAVLAAAQTLVDLDWTGGEATLQKALDLEPQNSDLLMRMGLLYVRTGRYDEAISFFKRSLTLNPIQSIAYINLGWALYLDNQLEEATSSIKKGLELNPRQLNANLLLARICLLQGNFELALKEINHETDEGYRTFGLCLTYHALGDKRNSDEMLNDLLLRYETKFPYGIAVSYAIRGEDEKAFQWLNKAYLLRDRMLNNWIKGDPLLKKLWHDPRYIALLRKMNLPLN